MTPAIPVGSRKYTTSLDLQGLRDIGWTLSGAQPQTEPEPMITLIGNRSVWDIDGGFVTIGGGGQWHACQALRPKPPGTFR